MADYTIELRHVVGNGHNIFDFNYPFYDESKRLEFEEKFIRHFYFREIGHPSIDRFKHYLRDKMLVAFPYYNELFKAATIEYSILDNYKLTEEFTMERNDAGKSGVVSSTVGQFFGKQESESEQERVTDSVGHVNVVGKDTDKETTNGETSGHSNTDTTNGEHLVKKYLDTPQGLTDISDSKYLTSLNDDDKTATGSATTDESGNSSTTRNAERNTLSNQKTTGKDTETGKASVTTSDEQKTTHDNNTRTQMEGKQTEKHTLVRSGNIGVDTDSDMIEKHIRLQKTLRNIERMFFDECEDLFMLVY